MSEVLSTSKQNYPHYQKMCYGVYFTANKLKQYFQEHVITIVSMMPIGEIIGCRDAFVRVAKWAIQLAGHTILYEPRTTIKSQALADFLATGPRPSTCRRLPTRCIGACTLTGPRCAPAWEPASSSLLPKVTSSDTRCKFTLSPRTMWPSMRRSYTAPPGQGNWHPPDFVLRRHGLGGPVII